MVMVTKADLDRSSNHSSRSLRDPRNNAAGNSVGLMSAAALLASPAPARRTFLSPFRTQRKTATPKLAAAALNKTSSMPSLPPNGTSPRHLASSQTNQHFNIEQSPRTPRGNSQRHHSSKSRRFASFLLEHRQQRQQRPSRRTSNGTTQALPTLDMDTSSPMPLHHSQQHHQLSHRKTVTSDKQLSSTIMLNEHSFFPPLVSAEDCGGSAHTPTESSAHSGFDNDSNHTETSAESGPPPNVVVTSSRCSSRNMLRMCFVIGCLILFAIQVGSNGSFNVGSDGTYQKLEADADDAADTDSGIGGSGSYSPDSQQIPTTSHVPTWAEIKASDTFSQFCSKSNKLNIDLAPLVDKHNVKMIIDQAQIQVGGNKLMFAQEYANVDATNITTAFTDQFVQSLLPRKSFVMKATHTSGCITKVALHGDEQNQPDTFKCFKPPCLPQQYRTSTKTSTAQKLQILCQKFLDTEYSDKYDEKFYRHIPKRCILEEYLLDEQSPQSFTEYKIHTFHGRPMIVQVMSDRYHQDNVTTSTRNVRTPDWHEIPLAINRKKRDVNPNLGPRPDAALDIMLDATQQLFHLGNAYLQQHHSTTFPYARVDFFVFGSNVAFAEMTFTHKSCGPLFDKKVHDWANKFYGFVGRHPEYDVAPNAILDLAAERKNKGGKR